MKRIMIEKELCVGCLNCALACMAGHCGDCQSVYELDLGNPANESRNQISLDRNKRPIPIFCRHCDEPECVKACISGAMHKDSGTGLVTYDETHCAACFMCVMACPFGVLRASAQEGKKVLKCDFCLNHAAPRCAENCPTGALRVEEVGK